MTSYRPRYLLLSALGAVVAAYLFYHHYYVRSSALLEPSFCSFSSAFDCDTVARSSYSELFGLPIATFALVFYLFLLSLLAPAKAGAPKDDDDLVLVLSGAALIPSTYLLIVSAFTLRTFCVFCLLLDMVTFALFFLAFTAGRRQVDSPRFAGRIRRGAGLLAGTLQPGKLRRPGTVRPGTSSRAGTPKSEHQRRIPSVPILLAILGIVILAGWYLKHRYFATGAVSASYQRTALPYYEDWQRQPQQTVTLRGEAGRDADYVRGNPRATVTVVVFSDFECPHCRRLAHLLEPVLAELQEKVRFVFKNYPIDPRCNPHIKNRGHEFACRSALAARCAGEQSPPLFWAAHDWLFRLPQIDAPALNTLPEALGINRESYESCLNDPSAMRAIADDIAAANRLGLQGTPTIFVNGRRLVAPPSTLPTVVRKIAGASSDE